MFNESRLSHADHVADLRQYRWLSAVIFSYFLLVALFALALPPRWRPFTSPRGERRSIVAQARSATHNFMPYVFMA
ncbi:MAG: hypothetical protein RLW62_02210 [Gammaproteobacteria bacterium]